MFNSRREFIRNSCLLSSALGLNVPSALHGGYAINQDGDRLVLLGTQGGPFVRFYKQAPSANLIMYKGVPFVIDTGYGVTFKLREAGISLPALKHIFITHHHSDHNLELGPLLYNSWLAGLRERIDVYAPVGLKSMLYNYWESNRFDIDTRIKDEGRPDIRELVISHEIAEGVVVSNSDFEVSAMKNIHPPVDESYAYKFKLGEKIVVFSGDTAYCPALAKFASSADYLVHEVMYWPAVDEMVKRRPNATKLKARAPLGRAARHRRQAVRRSRAGGRHVHRRRRNDASRRPPRQARRQLRGLLRPPPRPVHGVHGPGRRRTGQPGGASGRARLQGEGQGPAEAGPCDHRLLELP